MDSKTRITELERDVNLLSLTINLLKDGCRWEGDTMSRRYAEILIVPDSYIAERITSSLKHYEEGVDYKLERSSTGEVTAVCIAN